MAVAGQTVSEAASSFGCGRDAPSEQKPNLLQENGVVDDDAEADGCFDCNICFDSASDPVVTLCGHLYCWPCLYRWIDARSSSDEPGERHPTCPICKARISPSTLIPLYGRGSSSSSSSSESGSKKPDSDIAIPRRPSPGALSLNSSDGYSPSRQQPNPSLSHPQSSQEQQLIASFSSNAGMFGEMVYARMFGCSDASLGNDPQAYSYPGVVNSGHRMRRREMKLDRSFNRLSVFLFCCMVLCLLLF